MLALVKILVAKSGSKAPQRWLWMIQMLDQM
jgi:hypothetical protein